MASITNLEYLPQLVMEKITLFLDHKQLSAFEQVSKKLKCAVDAHFSVTDHLIIGPLPEVEYYIKVTAKRKKCLDGLPKIITRCGIRLRTIQITITKQFPFSIVSGNYRWYCKHFLASAEVSSNCPNIEYILVSPTVDIITMSDQDMFRQQNVLLHECDAEIYANNIKLSTGGRCKLRSLKLSLRRETEDTENSYQPIGNLFSHLEQISVSNPGENFYNILPQLIENGLKDLNINLVDFPLAKKLCNICKDLRTLRLQLCVQHVDDISALNTLQLPENIELKITLGDVENCFEHLNENVCNAIINCEAWGPADYSFMCKLKNVEQFHITDSDALQVIVEGSFPKLRKIENTWHLCDVDNCASANTCHLQKFLPQLLINKGNQLTHIRIYVVCKKSTPVVWKALKYCKAAKSIRFYSIEVVSPLTVTYEDMAAICDLPNLQHFRFSVRERKDDKGPLCARLRALLERAVKEHTDFQFEHELLDISSYYHEEFSLYRINF